MRILFSRETNRYQLVSSLLVFFGMIAVILAVLGFQHIGGYVPCKLCYGQREPYYAAIPLGGLVVLSALFKWPACLTRGGLAVIGLLMVYAMVLGVHHAGVEWAWWAGPADCGGGDTVENAGDLLSSLANSKPPACNEAAGRFLGLSFAGYNVLVSAGLAAIAFWGTLTGRSN